MAWPINRYPVGSAASVSSFITLAQQGVTFTIAVVDDSVHDLASLDARLALVARLVQAVPGSVIAIEGANEVNNWPVTYNGVSGLQGALALQQDLYAAVHANPALGGIPVDYFTGYAAGTIGVGPNPATTAGLADADTQHPYPVDGAAPASFVDPANAVSNETTGQTGPLVYTETGYSSNGGIDAGVDATVQAKYTLDLLFDAMADGVAHTDLYELMDAYAPGSPQGDDGYGLFDSNGNAKPVATAIHNLTTILADSAANASTFQTGTLAPTITGLPTTGRDLVLQKASGVFDVVVWAEPQIWNPATGTEVASPTENVTVSLGGTYATVAVYDPLAGSTPLRTLTDVGSVQIDLTDHPLILEVGALVPPPTIAITAQTLAKDTGASATDGITSDGAVTLAGTVTGAAGTTVQVLDGTSVLGTAVLDGKGGWTFATTLGAGAHALRATATDLAGNGASSAAAAAITVETAPPTVAVTAQVLAKDTGASATDDITSNGAVTLSGTVAGAAGTAVMVFDGTSALGAATLDGKGDWTYATTLGAGTHALAAVATDLAGNSAASATAASITVLTAPTVALVGETLLADAKTEMMTGTVTGAAGTSVAIYNGAALLGAATLDGKGGWSYAASIAPGSYNLTAVATDLAGNQASVDPAFTIPAPTATDTLVLNLSEDAYLGDAQFTVSVDGQQVGGTRTVTALRSAGQSQDFTVTGTFGPGGHAIGINFLNDRYDGTAATDRNLYVNAITLDGTKTVENTAQMSQGLATYAVAAQPATPDVLTLDLSEDAYLGDAQFTVSVDGQQVGGVQSVTALRSAGQTQDVTLSGAFGTGNHVVGVNFLNDRYDGTAATDRNLYVNAITLDGTKTVENAAQMSQGLATYAIATPVTTTDVLSLSLSEDAYLGDAQFTVSVDGKQVGGVQTATASHGAGHTQSFSLAGQFGTGKHTIGIDFLNDRYDGTAATDRNLYVANLTLDGATTVENAAQMSQGTANYTVQAPAAAVQASTPLALQVGVGATLILDATAAAGAAVTFAGAGGTLQFTDAASFHGSIAGFGAGDALDLRSIGFSGATSMAYAATAAGGTLTVSDGTHIAALSMKAGVDPSHLHLMTDGFGGTAVAFAS